MIQTTESSPMQEIEKLASYMLEQVDDGVKQAKEALTLIEDGQEPVEGALGHKGIHWKLPQGLLQAKERPCEQISSVLHDLIIFEQGDNEDEAPIAANIVPLTSVAKFSIISHATAVYCNAIDPLHLAKINQRLLADTTRWISHLFRFQDSNAYYHDDPIDGLVRITRLVIHLKCPSYPENGFKCFENSVPVLYASSPSNIALLQRICRHIGLPTSYICTIPTDQHTMDFKVLSQTIKKDVSEKKLPLLVLCETGSAVGGFTDDVLHIQEICRQNDVWLHLRGHNLATFAMINDLSPNRLSDSLTLEIGTWLGIPSLPTVTVFKQIKKPHLVAAGLASDLQKRLVVLPLWVALQALGRDNIQNRIKSCFVAVEILWSSLSQFPRLRILSQKPGGTSGSLTVAQISANPLTSPTLMFEVLASSIVLQFVPEVENGIPFLGKNPLYFDKLNNWMGQILQRDLPQFPVELCEIEEKGVAIRICPLESVLTFSPDDIQMLVNCIQQQLEILEATVTLKIVFLTKVKNHPQLEAVELPEWAGLGGVRYVALEENEMSQEELNKLNVEIVDKLRATDSAFSLGEANNGYVCVRFGMVTADTDIEELLTLVAAVGEHVEESRKDLDQMVEIVKKGIETATLDLQKESEEKIWQDGILRHVPVFGSLVNWWSPKGSETGVKGRSLNLQAGVVESTENIYKYHMQLQQGTPAQPGGKSPPQPLVQTPILTTGHSRSSSHASHSSTSPNQTIPIDGVES